MAQSKNKGQFPIISISFAAITFLIMGVYIAYTHEGSTEEEQLPGAFLEPHAITRVPRQLRDVAVVWKPIVPVEQTIGTDDALIKPRAAAAGIPGITAVTVLKFPDFATSHKAHNVSRMLVVREFVPSITSPEDMVYEKIRVVRGPMRPRLTSIGYFTTGSLLGERVFGEHAEDAGSAALAVYIGKAPPVKPLPKGEPGGRVIGRGKDIQGVLRLVRVRHNLSDRRTDQSVSLTALTNWLNTQTKIKTDMSVEGGAVRLTDPRLSKAPLVFFTGHDPYHTKRRSLIRGDPFRTTLSEPEREALREYIIEDGGFIFFDECAIIAQFRAITKSFLAQLRQVMPEYSADRIPNDHEIYHNYYNLGGPPTGFDVSWWGIHPPRRRSLTGITIAGHLRVLVCERDYMCSINSVSLPAARIVSHNPSAFRFFTNVVMYALTHGGISDYSHYVPEDKTTDEISTDDPVDIPVLE